MFIQTTSQLPSVQNDVLTGQYAGLHVIEYILSIFFVFSTRNNSCVCILLNG